MAATVADYIVVSKTGVDLQVGSDLDKDFNFSVPGSAAVGERAVLMLMVNTTNTDNLKADVRINGHNVFTYGPSDTNLARPFHAVLDGGVLKTGSNKMEVVISGSSGRFRATDLVQLFQNNVP
jgi:hypothetical protein